ncbi:MAG: UDP-N-acetylglucosamine 2-epimerase [Ignavibacteriae bacterium]|nr:UDP-N-acetylglucosamine 2-epimerase [Ignavibacteriota bacterium]
MQPNQSPGKLTAKVISSIDDYFKVINYDIVLVQGDITTVMAVSLVAFYHKIKVGSVEAGLGTFKIFSVSEEMNRVLTSRIAEPHLL